MTRNKHPADRAERRKITNKKKIKHVGDSSREIRLYKELLKAKEAEDAIEEFEGNPVHLVKEQLGRTDHSPALRMG